METIIDTTYESTDNPEIEQLSLNGNKVIRAYRELERGVYAALETYSNVHRGSGHNSIVSTHLFEQAKEIVLKYMGLDKSKFTVIFCSPNRATTIISQLKPKTYQVLSSNDIGLSIGIRALAVKKNALPKGIPFQTGGGTAKLMSQNWVIWSGAPDKFEAGTPAIINIIMFAKALQLTQKYGEYIFADSVLEKKPANEILYNDELEQYSGQELLNKLRKTLIGRNILVPTIDGMRPFINLDNAASTPTFKPVWDVFCQTLHQTGKAQQEIVHEVKKICSEFLGAPLSEYDIIFTSNTTESINLVSESLSRQSDKEFEPVIVNTVLEHSSNDLPWRMVLNHSILRLNVNDNGFIDLKELETLLSSYNKEGQFGKKRIRLVALSGASNVLGVCNNIDEISRIVHKYGAQLLVDAAQLVAHKKVDIIQSNIDYLAFSAHKVYAPFGGGVLVVKKGLLNFKPEELESIKFSGDENAAGIAAFGKSLMLLKRVGMEIIQKEEQSLTKRVLNGMKQLESIKVFGIKNPESPDFAHKLGVIVFQVGNIMPARIAKELALVAGIGTRFGCHCSHILVKRILNVSPFLERFQWVIQNLVPGVRFPGVARISLGIENTEEDVDRLINTLSKISQKSLGKVNINAASKLSEKPNFSMAEVKIIMKEFVLTASKKVFSQI
jgi:selenocysteine lyase/cysteine desulfurase